MVLERRSFTSLVEFIPQYSAVFDAIVNEILFFASFSNTLLSVYKNTSDFCILICFHPFPLQNSFIGLNFFSVEPLGCSI